MPMHVQALWRYPVKGLSAEALAETSLEPGRCLPGDRRFAVTLGGARMDPMRPEWKPKGSFVQLAQHPRLAALTTRWIEGAGTLTVERDGRIVAQAALTTPLGRTRLADFLSAYLKDAAIGTPRVVETSDFAFSDTPEPYVSIINSASLRDLERVAGAAIDPVRFRANILVSGTEPWAEFEWLGRHVRVGAALLRVEQRITRCKATNAGPGSGVEDLNVPRLLRGGFGHADFGVYARVIEGGRLAAGDEANVLPD